MHKDIDRIDWRQNFIVLLLPVGGVDIGSLECHDGSSSQPPKCVEHGKNFLNGKSGLAEEGTGRDESSWTALFDDTDRHAHQKGDDPYAEGVVEQRGVQGGSKEEGCMVLPLLFQVASSSGEIGLDDGVGADANEKKTGALNQNELLADVIGGTGRLLRLLFLLGLRGGSGLHLNVGII